MIVFNGFLLLGEHQPVEAYDLFLASSVLWLCAIPAWHFMITPRPTLGFMPIVAGLFATYFAMPIFASRPLFRDTMRIVEWSAVRVALEYTALGALMMVLGMLATKPLVVRLPRVTRRVDIPRALPHLVLVSAIGLAARIVTVGASVPRLGAILSTVVLLGLVALGCLLIGWLRGHLRPWHKFYFIGNILSIAGIGLASGSLANIAIPLSSMFFVYCWERHRIPWEIILAGVFLLAPFQVTKFEYRTLYWGDANAAGNRSAAAVPKLAGAFLSMTLERLSTGTLSSDEVVDRNQSRMVSGLATVAVVVNDTPRIVPYWNGYTYSDLLWHLVPRVLVPDKPSPPLGQEFPHRYGLLGYASGDTSYNLHQFVELYVNFGAMGVAAGMFVIGFIYRALDHSLSADAGGAAIGGVIFSGLTVMESNFSLVFGGLPLFLITFYVFIRWLPGQTGAPPTTSAART